MKGVPLVVVFEISPSHMKTFHYPPQHLDNHQVLPAAIRRLCVGSAKSEDQQVRRPHYVQVQSPISRTTKYIQTTNYKAIKVIYYLNTGSVLSNCIIYCY